MLYLTPRLCVKIINNARNGKIVVDERHLINRAFLYEIIKDLWPVNNGNRLTHAGNGHLMPDGFNMTLRILPFSSTEYNIIVIINIICNIKNRQIDR